MTIEEQIEVMNHFKNGGEVECKHCMLSDWERDVNPTWNWNANDYRIKPKPTPQSLEDRIKAEYPEYEVKMIKDNCYGVLAYNGVDPHVIAQSVKRFAGYVYFLTGEDNEEINEEINGFRRIYSPISYEGNHPIAVLFTKDSKEEA